MRSLPWMILLVWSSVAPAQAALPGDSAEGERLHAAHCTGCHDTKVYTRADRRVSSLDGLHQQMSMCEHATKTDFTAAQTQNLEKFLNERFYRFQ